VTVAGVQSGREILCIRRLAVVIIPFVVWGRNSSAGISRHFSIERKHVRTTEKVLFTLLGMGARTLAASSDPPLSPTNIFAPISTPADAIFDLSMFIVWVSLAIFVVVFSLLAYVTIKFRKKAGDNGREPAQIYGSTQVELAWTVIPVLIVAVLFLASARVIISVQNASRPPGAIEVTVIGHQYWWEYRYPDLKVVTAN
jgi:cytochrome c oxidase subunit 2